MKKYILLLKKEIPKFKVELILLLCVVVTFSLFVYQTKAIHRLVARLKLEEAKFQEIQAGVKGFSALKGKSLRIQGELDSLLRMLPKEEESSKFLGELASLAERFRIRFTSVKSLPQKKYPPYQGISINIAAEGEYHDFGRFLNEIEKLTNLFIDVKGFEINSDPSDPDSPVCRIGLTATTFRLLESGE